MYFTTVLASLFALGMVFAQSNNNNSTNVVTIQVGSTQSAQGGIYQFIPPSVTASNGTIVSFNFSGMPGNHSVTQSTFSSPCQPMQGGFDSGWVYLPSAGLQPVPQWNLTITDDSKPIWFYCKQKFPGFHCPMGMVGAINPPTSGNTIDAFRKAASSVSSVPQDQGGLVGNGASASVRPGPLPASGTDFPLTVTGSASGAIPSSSSSSSGAMSLSAGTGLLALVSGMTGVLLA